MYVDEIMDLLEEQKASHNRSSNIERCKQTSLHYPQTMSYMYLLNNQFQSTYNWEDLSYVPDKRPSPHPHRKDIFINNHGV